jgi:hypothetical protein
METDASMFVLAVPTWLHVGAFVLLPLAWGAATEFFFRWLNRHRKPPRPAADEHFFLDYHI